MGSFWLHPLLPGHRCSGTKTRGEPAPPPSPRAQTWPEDLLVRKLPDAFRKSLVSRRQSDHTHKHRKMAGLRAGSCEHHWLSDRCLSVSESEFPHWQDGDTSTHLFVSALLVGVHLIDTLMCIFLIRSDVEHLIFIYHLAIFFWSATWVFGKLGVIFPLLTCSIFLKCIWEVMSLSRSIIRYHRADERFRDINHVESKAQGLAPSCSKSVSPAVQKVSVPLSPQAPASQNPSLCFIPGPSKTPLLGLFLEVQWLRVCASTTGGQIWSLVGELR